MTSVPPWAQRLAAAARTSRALDLSRFAPPRQGGRASAVLILLGQQPATGPDVLVLERASTLREHAGQPAFPGGGSDPGDPDRVATALREAQEEVGLDPASVTVLATLPELWLPVSSYVVTPVLGWWHAAHDVLAMDAGEVAHVVRIPLAELADPANRVLVRHPSGYVGPAFRAGGMLVWGFTAGLLDRLLVLGGWERPWDRTVMISLPTLR